jgi:hypothetical protein
MTPAIWNWLLTIVGTIASVAGVVFSMMAWIQATKAKDAAREATNAVRKRNTAQQVLKLAGDAKEFLSSVQQNRAENAVSAANSLSHSLSLLRTQSIADFPDTDTLKACLAMITTVAIRLNVGGVPEDSTEREGLLVLCHGIHRSVCDLAGRMERLSEGARP